MYFPGSGSGSGRPWARLDGRSGMMLVSAPDGGKNNVDLKGKTLSLNLLGAKQGWLAVTAAGADWKPLAAADQWGVPPSPEHKPGVEIDIHCGDGAFGDAPVRVARGNSKGWTGFVAAVATAAGAIPADAWPSIKVNSVRVVKVGQGTSVDVQHSMLPREQWARGLTAGNSAAATAAEF